MKKDCTLTMRISEELNKKIEEYAEKLTKDRGDGARKVSKSEAIEILILAGIKGKSSNNQI